MKNNLAKKIFFTSLAFIFWLSVWEIFAILIKKPLILPRVTEVFSALFGLTATLAFWKNILFSFIRIVLGYIIGIVFGALLAVFCYYFKIADHFISPLMTVVKATPVASFIMVMWLMLGSDLVPSAITVMMVTPIIWQNLKDGFDAIDPGLSEVSLVFELSPIKRFGILILPMLLKFFVPGIITAAGLAWKSGIAAEIIAYTTNSIGKEIFNAKSFLESAEMLAWTLVVIIISLLFEFTVSVLGRRFSRNGSDLK